MKIKILKVCGAITVTAAAVTVHADPIPQWASSYSVGNSCYCTPSIDSGLATSIVPTPVGGQSVAQVCQRIGPGPELSLTNGEFNYPVYEDAQCGNGPASSAVSSGLTGCDGSMTLDGSVCLGVGPKWELTVAYAKPALGLSPAEPVAAETQAIESDASTNLDIVKSTPVSEEVETLPLATVVDTQVISETPDATIVSTRVIEPESIESSDSSATGVTVVAERVIGPADTAPATKIESAQSDVAAPAAEEVDLPPVKTIATLEETENPKILDEKERARLEAAELVAEKEEERKINNAPATVSESTIAEAPVVVEPLVVEPVQAESSVLVEDTKPEATAAVTEAGEGPDSTASATAVRVPFRAPASTYSHNFVQISPIGYDFGGSGAAVDGSIAASSRFNFIGRAAVAEDYSEYMLGVSTGFAPEALRGGTIALAAGVEHGVFDLGSTTLGKTELADTGALLAGAIGYNLTPKLHLQGGVSYSSFLEGDPSIFGLILLKMTNELDIAGRAEGGDNDNVSVGLRFNY